MVAGKTNLCRIAQLVARARRVNRRHGTQLIVVDHLLQACVISIAEISRAAASSSLRLLKVIHKDLTTEWK
jgi:hypothetical protein